MELYQPMINRRSNMTLVRAALKRSRIVALLGPRQSRKTTLARHFVAPTRSIFSLSQRQLLDFDGEKRPARWSCGREGSRTSRSAKEAVARPDLDLDFIFADRRSSAKRLQAHGCPCLKMSLAIGAALNMPSAQYGFGPDVLSFSVNVRKGGNQE